MAAVTLSGVCKSFGSVEAVRDVSLDIADGMFVVLVGPSGCGKSTLLRMIAGLEPIGAGDIRIGGRIVNAVPPKDRDVAMVFQNYALYPHMTVARNMGFSLKLRGERQDVIDRKVREAAAILGLEAHLDRLPKQLSGGQRQRVAMGRSIVRAPQVFLFDEPLSNLDAGLRVHMRTEIKDLHRRLKTTTVYVTHDQIEAMTMADTIVVVRNGRVEQVGAPLDVYDRPANLFVATFIGSPAMNVLEAEVHGSPRPALRIGANIDLPLPPGLDVVPGQRVYVGIRPEHLVLAQTGLEAEIVTVEPTGSDTHLSLRVGNQAVVAAVRDRVRLEPGATVRVEMHAEALHFFDRQTELRIDRRPGVQELTR